MLITDRALSLLAPPEALIVIMYTCAHVLLNPPPTPHPPIILSSIKTPTKRAFFCALPLKGDSKLCTLYNSPKNISNLTKRILETTVRHKSETIWIRFESWRLMRFWYYMFSFWCIRAKAKVNSSIISRILCTASIFNGVFVHFSKCNGPRKTQYCLLCN